MSNIPRVSYMPSPQVNRQPLFLVLGSGTPEEQRFIFYDHVDIGRYHESRASEVGILLIDDNTVSRRHCVITQASDGRCHIRDVSRNGTWVDGRRLTTNLEVDVRIGQVIRVGNRKEFVLQAEADRAPKAAEESDRSRTINIANDSLVTVLVGDIRDYTVMVRETLSGQVQESVSRVFQELERAVQQYGGIIKEYQGDAIFAYWDAASCENPAVEACNAVLKLDQLVRKMADDPEVWNIANIPLQIDWALTTGHVVISTLGGDRPTGMSMVGEPVVLAFRIEKLANDERGSILACAATHEAAEASIEFRDLGEVEAKGFDQPARIFGVLGSKAKQE